MKKTIITLFFAAVSFISQGANADEQLLAREDVKQFIQKMHQKHHYDQHQLRDWLGQVTISREVLDSVAKPAEKMAWHHYQPIFISDKRIQEGVNFWRANEKSLKKAQAKYGVPPEMIVAILGAETFYGKHIGKHKVLDTLVTLAFDYPPRSKFFLSELEEFLLLAREEQWDPTQIKGSYAGAMGNPQFIASSYRRYAVDFNQNGRRDLMNMDDSIGSVGNYFKLCGWKAGGPIVIPATAKGSKFQDIVASKSNPKPSHSLRELAQVGVGVGAGISVDNLKNETVALVVLQGKAGPEYWLGAHNFWVITRYNHSDNYAMAIYTLGQKIKEAYHRA